jgi:hypothetical protein
VRGGFDKRTDVRLKTLACVALLIQCTISSYAEVIDFEAIAEGTALGTVKTSTNAVTFSVGGDVEGPAYVAGVGLPMTAFNPNDTPSSPNHAGSRFLTDEPRGPSRSNDYFLKFAQPVWLVSLEVYDFRVDGGPRIGDSVSLVLYSDDSFQKPVGRTSFVIKGDEPDQNVVPLKVMLECLTASSARIQFSRSDIGTGVDNITFETAVQNNNRQNNPTSPCLVSIESKPDARETSHPMVVASADPSHVTSRSLNGSRKWRSP